MGFLLTINEIEGGWPVIFPIQQTNGRWSRFRAAPLTYEKEVKIMASTKTKRTIVKDVEKDDEVIILTLLGTPPLPHTFLTLSVLPNVKTLWPKYQAEVMRRHFAAGGWGTRPKMFYFYHSDCGHQIYFS